MKSLKVPKMGIKNRKQKGQMKTGQTDKGQQNTTQKMHIEQHKLL
jgi:hypothetical protein